MPILNKKAIRRRASGPQAGPTTSSSSCQTHGSSAYFVSEKETGSSVKDTRAKTLLLYVSLLGNLLWAVWTLPLLLNGPHKNPSTRVSNVSDPWIDQAFTGESIPSLDHSPKPEFGRTYGYEDFITQFNVVPVHKVEVDPSVAALLASHKVENDPAYLEDPEHYEDAVRRYSQVVEFGTGSDTRFYVAWTGPERGYGMFPRVPIVAGEPLGVYAGVVTNNSMNSAYAWGYNSDKQIKDEEGNLVGLVIDGRDRGNMLRFANHAKDPNSEAVILPWKNLWHVIYVAKRDIQADEEITVSYGDAYWEAMDKSPVLL